MTQQDRLDKDAGSPELDSTVMREHGHRIAQRAEFFAFLDRTKAGSARPVIYQINVGEGTIRGGETEMTWSSLLDTPMNPDDFSMMFENRRPQELQPDKLAPKWSQIRYQDEQSNLQPVTINFADITDLHQGEFNSSGGDEQVEFYVFQTRHNTYDFCYLVSEGSVKSNDAQDMLVQMQAALDIALE